MWIELQGIEYETGTNSDLSISDMGDKWRKEPTCNEVCIIWKEAIVSHLIEVGQQGPSQSCTLLYITFMD